MAEAKKIFTNESRHASQIRTPHGGRVGKFDRSRMNIDYDGGWSRYAQENGYATQKYCGGKRFTPEYLEYLLVVENVGEYQLTRRLRRGERVTINTLLYAANKGLIHLVNTPQGILVTETGTIYHHE